MLSLRSSTVRASRCTACARGRAPVVRVAALFGNNADAERKKQEQWEAQQALLEERRAKRDRLMRDFGRKGAKAEPEERAEPAPKKSRPVKVVQEEEEDEVIPEVPRQSGGNPLSGLLGGFFNKK